MRHMKFSGTFILRYTKSTDMLTKEETHINTIKEGLSVCLYIYIYIYIPQASTVLDQSSLNLAWTLGVTCGVGR